MCPVHLETVLTIRTLSTLSYDSAAHRGFEWGFEGDKTFPRVYYCYVSRLNEDVANDAWENVQGRLMRRALLRLVPVAGI